MVLISLRWFFYAEVCSALSVFKWKQDCDRQVYVSGIPTALFTDRFMFLGFLQSRLQTGLCFWDSYSLVYRQLFVTGIPTVSFTDSFLRSLYWSTLPVTSIRSDSVWYVRRFLTHCFLQRIVLFTCYRNIGLTAGVTGLQGMIAPPRYLVPLLVYSGVLFCPLLWFVFPTGLMRWTAISFMDCNNSRILIKLQWL
jgi:hypothetical protein